MEITRQIKAKLASNQMSASALRSAGFSASALRSAGFSASDVLSAGFSASALRSAGFSASALRSAGFSASALRSAGFSASDVLSAGFSASDVLSAGFSASDVLSAGFSASALRSAGFSASDVAKIEEFEASIPLIENPYSTMLAGILDGQRKHNQSTFGPDCDATTNLCKTAMCTAGHLVQMAGKRGYELKNEFGFAKAASLLHFKAHPDWPCQDFGGIRQDFALAYIEEMADWEKNGRPVEPEAPAVEF